MFNRGVSRVKSMMIENGGKEPTFNVDKITAFEVISYSAIKQVDLQEDIKDFPKSFPKSLDKLMSSYIQDKDRDAIEVIIKQLFEPKTAKELAAATSSSTKTIKDKYLGKMIEAGIIAMTIPDKPQSSKQKYKLILGKE